MIHAIRTPDQRLRVFVSSTLKELADERTAARIAIERLAAAPVMFELGARPHPPRELYRAYLGQSDIFVGLYWEKYGWVAPGESISGLEDEYNLAPPTMPRLIYIKQSSGAREPRLIELLDRIRSDDRASFKHFTGADELGALIVADLAVLLAERFDQSRLPAPLPRTGATPEGVGPAGRRRSLPAPLTRLLGREQAVAGMLDTLRDPEVRLVTVTGPGGIGKTRLAIETARRAAGEFRDGAIFVPLAAIQDPAGVPSAIAQSLGLRETGDLDVLDAVLSALQTREVLVVLDNFEQVLPAAPLVSAVLEAAERVKVLVTSRVLLRVSGERSVEVGSLELPSRTRRGALPALPASVALLLDRARAVRPDFELTAENLAAVEGIALRLEGVPLALELAAARLRVLSPESLLDRLQNQLALLTGGGRDQPPRQQAVRSTIEWSTRLLSDEERDLLWRLGVFAGRFTLEDAEALAPDAAKVLPLLEALVDGSLIRQQERSGGTFLTMLGTIREFALEQLEAQGLVQDLRDRHARRFLLAARAAAPDLIGPRQRTRIPTLAAQRDDFRAAARHLVERRRWDELADFAWALLPYCWVDGLLSDARAWMTALLDSGDRVPDRTRAIALGLADAVFFWREPTPRIIAELSESAEILENGGSLSEAGTALISLAVALQSGPAPDEERAIATLERALRLARISGNTWGESMALTTYGGVLLRRQDLDGAIERFEAGLRLADAQQDHLLQTMAGNNLAWAHLLLGDTERALPLFGHGLRTSLDIGHEQGVAWALEGLSGVAALLGDAHRSGELAGAAQALRDRLGVADRADSADGLLEKVRTGARAPQFARAWDRGRTLPLDEAVRVAGEVTGSLEAVRTR